MTKGILGRKVGMTQIFSEDGELIPVTIVQAEPNVVLQKRTLENDGYEAIQVGFADQKPVNANKPATGHAAKASTTPKRFIREFRNVELDAYEVGQEINVEAFQAGDIIDVTGTSKGKGFQGAIKRHNQQRGPMGHGSHFHRSPGSMGAAAEPARVMKGKKLPGQMGSVLTTLQNLEVVKVDAERNLLLVKGNVPGPKKSFVKITSAIKASK